MQPSAPTPAPRQVALRNIRNDDVPVFFEHQRDPEATQMADVPARDWAAHAAHRSTILADDTVIARTPLVDGQVAGNVVSWDDAARRKVGYEVRLHGRAAPRTGPGRARGGLAGATGRTICG